MLQAKVTRLQVEQQTFTPELIDFYLQEYDAKPETVRSYSKGLKHFSEYLQVNGISTPDRTDLIRYKTFISETLKAGTVNYYINTIKALFTWTAWKGYYPNIGFKVKGVKNNTRTHKKDCLSSNEASLLLNSIDTGTVQGKRDKAIIRLMVTTGLRVTSIMQANIEDLRTVSDSSVLFYKGKGREDKDRYVKITEPVRQLLKDYLLTREQKAPGEPLFVGTSNNGFGQRMTTRAISMLVKNRLKDAGYDNERITAHSLRHTAATLNLLSGGTLEETQQLLDHSSINTTMIYLHHVTRIKNNSEQRIDGLIGD
jgi:integrase/recombinase XerC